MCCWCRRWACKFSPQPHLQRWRTWWIEPYSSLKRFTLYPPPLARLLQSLRKLPTSLILLSQTPLVKEEQLKLEGGYGGREKKGRRSGVWVWNLNRNGGGVRRAFNNVNKLGVWLQHLPLCVCGCALIFSLLDFTIDCCQKLSVSLSGRPKTPKKKTAKLKLKALLGWVRVLVG